MDPSTGVVTGTGTSGSFIISYVVTNTCGTFTVTHTVYIRPASRCTTGITPIAENHEDQLKVFPNPNDGSFTVNMVSDADEPVHVYVTNMVGEKVAEMNTVTNNATDMKLNLPTGIYLLIANTEHGRYVSKVTIQK